MVTEGGTAERRPHLATWAGLGTLVNSSGIARFVDRDAAYRLVGHSDERRTEARV